MTNTEKLDATDIRILRALQQNARLTVKELAARVNLSPSPTFERQKRLEREGYIQRYVAVADHHKLGNHVIARIREAERYVPLERLYLSPQCGFASCEIGNKLTEDDQWAKLRLVQDIAHQVWG